MHPLHARHPQQCWGTSCRQAWPRGTASCPRPPVLQHLTAESPLTHHSFLSTSCVSTQGSGQRGAFGPFLHNTFLSLGPHRKKKKRLLSWRGSPFCESKRPRGNVLLSTLQSHSVVCSDTSLLFLHKLAHTLKLKSQWDLGDSLACSLKSSEAARVQRAKDGSILHQQLLPASPQPQHTGSAAFPAGMVVAPASGTPWPWAALLEAHAPPIAPGGCSWERHLVVRMQSEPVIPPSSAQPSLKISWEWADGGCATASVTQMEMAGPCQSTRGGASSSTLHQHRLSGSCAVPW